jgi:transposase
MNVTLIGLDLAKNIIQICGVNQAGKQVFNRAVKRHRVIETLMQYPRVPVAMEACSGSNFWGRLLEQHGHQALLIPPQHVKAFVRGNKNDRNDAFAVCEAARRPGLQFVRPRSLEQVDMLWAHRLRERLVGQRTRLINQLRGMLQEYGVVVPRGKEKLREQIPWLLEDAENGLTPVARHHLQQTLQEWQDLDERIEGFDREIARQCRASEPARRLTGIKGVGKTIATAIVAFAGDGSQYRSARHFSANLGLVPKEHSSGGRQRLGGITKRGNTYIRRLLIQGAWSIIRYANGADDRLSRWARQLIERRGKQRAAVAVANKLARIIWALLYRGGSYQAG